MINALHGTLVKVGDTVYDIYEEFGVVTIDFPFLTINATPKNIASISYFDENGDYEFIPDVIKYEPQEFEVKFGIKGTNVMMGINGFLSLITSSQFSIYNNQCNVGRQKCRVLSVKNPTDFYKIDTTKIVIFTIRIKSNDPINNITLAI